MGRASRRGPALAASRGPTKGRTLAATDTPRRRTSWPRSSTPPDPGTPTAASSCPGPTAPTSWLFLAATVLFVGEARALRRHDFRLDAVPPHVQIPAGVAKSRREECVPLRSDLIAMLAARGEADRRRLPPGRRPQARRPGPHRGRPRPVDDVHHRPRRGRHLTQGRHATRPAFPDRADNVRHTDPALPPSAVDQETTIPGRPWASPPKGDTIAAASAASVVPSVAPPAVSPGQFGAPSGTAEAPRVPTKKAPGVA